MLFPESPITVEHIRAFYTQFNEGYRVEYKGTFDANVRDKIPKVLSSFANSHGGVLVVGVNTLNGVPQPPSPPDHYNPSSTITEILYPYHHLDLVAVFSLRYSVRCAVFATHKQRYVMNKRD